MAAQLVAAPVGPNPRVQKTSPIQTANPTNPPDRQYKWGDSNLSPVRVSRHGVVAFHRAQSAPSYLT